MSQSAAATKSMPHDGIADQLDYENQYVSFYVDRQLLGIPVHAVQEVLTSQTTAPVPRASVEIAGLLNLRGQIVTALNLRRRLGLPALETGRSSMNIVVRHQGESYSLLVDDVGDVINVAGNILQAPPATLDQHWKSVTAGVFRLEQRLFVILNVGSLLKFG